MVRAAVLIGVSRAGLLEELQAVYPGVRAMQKWAAGQGIDPKLVKVITDENGPVEISAVKRAVRQLVELTTVEQLIVYFAGHGVNLSLSEYWLLSDAPDDTNAAVNLAASVELARFSGIPHVVFVSDACRTAAEGIQAQSVRGSEIFPNIPEAAVERPVDVFFACALGAPALEVKDPKKAAAGYRAIYTESLVDALEGRRNVVVKDPEEGTELQLIEPLPEGGRGVVRPWPLSFHLRDEVLRRLERSSLKPGLSQTPVARINSRRGWLAEVPLPARRPGKKMSLTADRAAFSSQPAAVVQPQVTLFEQSSSLLRLAMSEEPLLAEAGAHFAGRAPDALLAPASRIFAPFGPAELPSRCGFKIRGDRFVSALGSGALAEVAEDGRSVSVAELAGDAAPVLLELAGGSGLVLPAFPDFIASVTVEDREVVNVTYEPATNSPMWERVGERRDELRNLRALLASSARQGVFRLGRGDAERLSGRIRTGKGLDPTMALYAGYALWDRQESDRLDQLAAGVAEDLGCALFDLALLSGGLRESMADVVPFFPLLGRGWPLLAAHRSKLPEVLGDLAAHRRESLWTLFDAGGVRLLRDVLGREAR